MEVRMKMQSVESNVGINLQSIVKDISKRGIFKRVLKEAITNSIHAKATQIDYFIEVENTLFDNDKKLKNEIMGCVQKIII